MTESVKRRAGLADFLRTRRARLRPEQFGFPTKPSRHTPGLRREELAQLVGVGISWYTWLEQGRNIQVSCQVLERLADILQLNGEERCHLFILARGPKPLLEPREHEIQTSPYQAILDALGACPAYVLDRRLNVIAWNESASRVIGDFTHRSEERARNLLWSMFMLPSSRKRFANWERAARGCIARFRALSDQYPDDRWLAELIADLQEASPEFRAWWPRHDILLRCKGSSEIQHPLVGLLAFQQTMLAVPERSDWQMVVHTPLPQTDTAAKLDAIMRAEARLRWQDEIS
ncbi:transcriptional regulator [Ktedonosporobacter rubrisoli]|uniref:Transcriptional regulator n=1 Tax=Ktedonosporobacter rubrisoli TaxID=2509675 RepID=A0A4P6JLY8_KTERU|nr:helix-turn-helix transcriptional regulator [Ktedonosporobacter rubrisoli]QBD76012.1 transcriptional regulator [Ktedonosporobacter rubrisoli]